MTEEKILSELIELCEKQGFDKQISAQIQAVIKSFGSGFVGVAQINTIVGNIEYNAEKIVKYISASQDMGLDLVVFAQFSLVGFPLGDLIDRYSHLAQENMKWLKQIAKITTKITALVGFLEQDDEGKYYNSIAVLADGKVEKIIRKSFVQNESNDFRYIQSKPSNDDNLICVNGLTYEIVTLEENISAKADVIVLCEANRANIVSDVEKQKFLSDIARKYSASLIYSNQVGANDGFVFEGASKVYNKDGKIIAQAKSFKEQLLIANPKLAMGKIYNYSTIESSQSEKFSLDYDYDLERTYKTLVLGIKDYFGKNGFKRAVLGLSGGLDSTVCAVLLVDALGKENVFGVSMPSKITTDESKNDAQELAKNLEIGFVQIPIKDMTNTITIQMNELFANVEKYWGSRYSQSFTQDNIQARSRAMLLWGVSNEFANCLPIATSDKSEIYMGYATINGDMSGGFAPIADITKTKLFALARWLNKNRPVKDVIAQNVITKPPGAELAIDPKTGKPLIAEDALMPYEFLDEVIWRIENKHETFDSMIKSQFVYETKNNLTKAQKREWLEKFYRRMACATYKKSILPPYVIVDSKINNYQIPISSKINYENLSEEIIEMKIQEFL